MAQSKSGSSRSRDDSPLKEKVEEIRRRLMGNPTTAELESMQLQLEVMGKWAHVAEMDNHDHDHMADHDHSLQAEPSIVLNPSDLTRVQGQGGSKSR